MLNSKPYRKTPKKLLTKIIDQKSVEVKVCHFCDCLAKVKWSRAENAIFLRKVIIQNNLAFIRIR
jgi:hypothetical protein